MSAPHADRDRSEPAARDADNAPSVEEPWREMAEETKQALHDERVANNTQRVDCWACEAAQSPTIRSLHTEDARRETFAEVSHAMNLIADVWERDGSDPCRVRISREYANAYRAYAEGFGAPTGSAKFRATLRGPEPTEDGAP